MARFYGEVGFGIPREIPEGSGNWKDEIREKAYTGDVIRNARNLEAGDKVNDDVVIANSFSIVADDFAIEHFALIKYVKWMGVRWVVTSVEAQRPRLLLHGGKVYNGPTP